MNIIDAYNKFLADQHVMKENGGKRMNHESITVSTVHENLLRFFNRKCDGIDRRGRERNLAGVDRRALWNWFYERYNIAFYCGYCGVELSDDSSQDDRVFTFDHRTPISRGGDNSLENLELACNACNSVKGRMSAETFTSLLARGKRTLVMQIYQDYRDPMTPKVQSDNQCDNCQHRRGEKCDASQDQAAANNRDSDWCGMWNA